MNRTVPRAAMVAQEGAARKRPAAATESRPRPVGAGELLEGVLRPALTSACQITAITIDPRRGKR